MSRSTKTRIAREIARRVTRSEILGDSPAHQAARKIEIERNAEMIDRLAREARLDLAVVLARMETQQAPAPV